MGGCCAVSPRPCGHDPSRCRHANMDCMTCGFREQPGSCRCCAAAPWLLDESRSSQVTLILLSCAFCLLIAVGFPADSRGCCHQPLQTPWKATLAQVLACTAHVPVATAAVVPCSWQTLQVQVLAHLQNSCKYLQEPLLKPAQCKLPSRSHCMCFVSLVSPAPSSHPAHLQVSAHLHRPQQPPQPLWHDLQLRGLCWQPAQLQ